MPVQYIKICGLTDAATARASIAAGATHIGLVHFAPSPRHLALADAAALRAAVADRAKAVLLTVDLGDDAMAEAIDTVRPDIVQLHGSETPEHAAAIRARHGVEVWKALGIADRAALVEAQRYAGAVEMLLYDAPPPSPPSTLPGGNGAAFDWGVLAGFDHRAPWGLAGGLTPANVAHAITATGAPLVDVSSGVESAPGVKDVGLIRAFCEVLHKHDKSKNKRQPLGVEDGA